MTTNAQKFIDPREAKEFYENGNYFEAMKMYKKLTRQEPENAEYYHRIGICYLRSNIDKKKAISYLEKAIKLPKFDEEAYYHLGMAYQYALKFDEAVKMYKKYEEEGKGNDKVKRQLETCYSAKELVKYPVDISFENLGPNINTPFPDYYPFVAKDESYIVFTSRRKGNKGGIVEFDGFYPSDIWVAENGPEEFQSAKNGGNLINSVYDEQCVGLSDDAKTMFIYVDKIEEYGDIYISEYSTRSFKRMEKMGENVNSKELETSASISADGNTLFFTSAREGEGGLDLFMTRKLPNGQWARPQNLGPKINSKYNEGFPTLSGDGKTLYFCSEGHASMGGYDLFKAIWDPESNSWSAPTNLGYPINTPEDNRTISFSGDGKHAYVSAVRDDGFGDLDIYKIIFNNVDEPMAIFRVQLPTGDTLNPYNTDAFVSVEDETNTLIGDYVANMNNGNYTIILKPGKYTLVIDSPNHSFYTKELVVTEEDTQKSPITKKIQLSPQ